MVVGASMSPSWTNAMLQGGPRVSVIPCYRSWVGWPAQHSTERHDTQRRVLCANDLGGCDRAADVRAECGSFLSQSVVLISLLYTGHNETSARCIQGPGSQWTFTIWQLLFFSPAISSHSHPACDKHLATRQKYSHHNFLRILINTLIPLRLVTWHEADW